MENIAIYVKYANKLLVRTKTTDDSALKKKPNRSISE
jgi:hypothetical protein